MKENSVKVVNRINNFLSLEKLNISFSKKEIIKFFNGSEEIEAIITCFSKADKNFLYKITVKILSNSRQFSHLEVGEFFFGHYDSKKREMILFSTVP
ncbi:MAG TPA: hypothetical protein PLE28_01605 [bacterium]|nr:hypothetical protein [bacterium]